MLTIVVFSNYPIAIRFNLLNQFDWLTYCELLSALDIRYPAEYCSTIQYTAG